MNNGIQNPWLTSFSKTSAIPFSSPFNYFNINVIDSVRKFPYFRVIFLKLLDFKTDTYIVTGTINIHIALVSILENH